MPSFRKIKKKDESHDNSQEVKQVEGASPTIEGETADTTEGQDDQASAAVKHKKKKFSFSRKKKPSKSYSKDDIRDNETTLVELEPGKVVVVEKRTKPKDGKVRRAQSLVLDDLPEKRRKFWKIHRSKSSKKAKSANTSAADHDTASIVTNPDMDEWRMSGLLNSAEKSKAAVAISTTKNNASETVEDGKPNENSRLPVTSTPVKQTIKEVADQAGDVVSEAANGNSVDNKENATKVPESEKFVETAGLDYEYSSEMHVSFASKTATMEPVEEDAIGETHVEDAECSPTFDGGMFGTSVYPLDKKNKIIARDLCDVIREGQIELDQSVDVTGWLVLNMAKEDWIIVQCTKDDDEVIEVRDNSVEAV